MNLKLAGVTYDVITLGETMLRLTPPHYQRLEQANQFEIEVGGSESNTAVGLARLGVRTAWLSGLPTSPLGRLAIRSLAGYGVDTSHVVWVEDARMGLYFLERGKTPRSSQVIYDRKGSAASHMTPDLLPLDLFHESGARLLHLTGITPALSEGAASTAYEALERAQEAGWMVSFDLNYRRRLWQVDQARKSCQPFMQAATILLVPIRDVISFLRLPPGISATDACVELSRRYPDATIAITLGKEGAVGCMPSGDPLVQPAFHAEEVDRLGAGDAFTAGFLYGYLESGEIAHALRWGAAAAAIKYTIPGDIPLFEKQEIESLMENGQQQASVRR
jgi:2-dehydro-3-deoxygluconokinase